MSNFVSKEPIKVMVAEDGPDGEWVMIKPKMSVGDRGLLSDRIMSVNTAGGKTDVDVKAGQYLQAMLEVNIVDWHMSDDEGNLIPFKKELIASLDPDSPLIDKVLAEIAERNPTLSGSAATSG